MLTSTLSCVPQNEGSTEGSTDVSTDGSVRHDAIDRPTRRPTRKLPRRMRSQTMHPFSFKNRRRRGQFATLGCVVACTLLAGGNSSAVAQSGDESLAVLKTRTSSFFRNLKEGVEPERAFDELLVNGPLAANGPDGKMRNKVNKLIDRIRALQDSYGPLLEAEEVDSRMIGRDLVRQKYLFKTERLPIVWYFTYYRPPIGGREDDDWFVISVRFDMRFESLAD